MQWKHALMASSAMLAAALGTTAHAQTKPGSTAAASNTIEELVVTAEKRAQSLRTCRWPCPPSRPSAAT